VKVEVQIDPALDQPVIVLRAPMPTAEVEELARRLRAEAVPQPFTVYTQREAVRVGRPAVLRFYAEDKGVFCQTAQGVYTVRQRLYELEEELAGTKFVRVSNSEIVNLDRVAALDLTLAGTIKMTLEGGTVCWVSRRYVKKIKQALGL
jgi:DNA-binding LytR/AlgR family response regulator